MKRLKLNVLFIFGTAKIAYKIVECVKDGTIVIIFSTSNYHETRSYELSYKDTDEEYDKKRHKFVSDSDYIDGTMGFLESGIDVYVMNVFTHIRLIEIFKYFYAISCCRNGLPETYIPLLDSYAYRGLIVSFDNNKSIAEEANEISVNSIVLSGVAHCYAPLAVEWNEDKSVATIKAEKFGYLVFPPFCEVFRTFFAVKLSSPVAITFTETPEEYQRAVDMKMLNCNALHTLACCVIKTLYPQEYEQMNFGDIDNYVFDGIVSSLLEVHRNAYYNLWAEGENYDFASKLALSFLDNLRKYKDPCVRGVDFNSKTSIHKASVHLRFMRKAGIDVEEYVRALGVKELTNIIDEVAG